MNRVSCHAEPRRRRLAVRWVEHAWVVGITTASTPLDPPGLRWLTDRVLGSRPQRGSGRRRAWAPVAAVDTSLWLMNRSRQIPLL